MTLISFLVFRLIHLDASEDHIALDQSLAFQAQFDWNKIQMVSILKRNQGCV